MPYPTTLEGGCLCRRIRYRITGEAIMAALCHCTTCRRAHGAPAVAWALYEASQVQFTAGQPTDYASSEGVRRGFCPHCGTPLCFRSEDMEGLIDVSIGSLDDPGRVPPTFHYWDAERLPWLRTADDWPRHAEFPPLC